jgi:hypothetical protein
MRAHEPVPPHRLASPVSSNASHSVFFLSRLLVGVLHVIGR